MTKRTTSTPQNNIMEAKKAAASAQTDSEEKAEGIFTFAEAEAEQTEKPRGYSEQDLLDLIGSLKDEVAELREAQNKLIATNVKVADLTDDMLYIVKPNDRQWEERRVIDGKIRAVEFTASGFYGPFESQEQIDNYCAAKCAKRPEYAIYWDPERFRVMTGREARRLDAQETATREAQFGSQDITNVLDRRIFAQQHTGHQPGTAKLVESIH